MANYKASVLVFLREEIAKRGTETQAAFLGVLTPEEARAYKNALPMSWVPAPTMAGIISNAAHILHPHDPKGAARLGYVQAKYDLTGIYKVLLKVITIPILINQTARLWSNYHAQGTAHGVVVASGKEGTLVVEGYPDLPEPIRRMTTGYTEATVEMAGVNDVRVEENFTNPDAWKWRITWR